MMLFGVVCLDSKVMSTESLLMYLTLHMKGLGLGQLTKVHCNKFSE